MSTIAPENPTAEISTKNHGHLTLVIRAAMRRDGRQSFIDYSGHDGERHVMEQHAAVSA